MTIEKGARRAVLRGKGLGDKLGGAGKYLQDQLVKNDPTFPRPFPIGNRTGFWEDDVDAWLLKKRDEAIKCALAKAQAEAAKNLSRGPSNPEPVAKRPVGRPRRRVLVTV